MDSLEAFDRLRSTLGLVEHQIAFSYYVFCRSAVRPGLGHRFRLRSIWLDQFDIRQRFAIFGRIKPIVLDSFELEFDSTKFWDDRFNSPKSVKDEKCNFEGIKSIFSGFFRIKFQVEVD